MLKSHQSINYVKIVIRIYADHENTHDNYMYLIRGIDEFRLTVGKLIISEYYQILTRIGAVIAFHNRLEIKLLPDFVENFTKNYQHDQIPRPTRTRKIQHATL